MYNGRVDYYLLRFGQPIFGMLDSIIQSLYEYFSPIFLCFKSKKGLKIKLPMHN